MFNAVLPRPINVRFFPDYRAFNPYQELLYRSLGPTVTATPISEAADLAGGAEDRNKGDILHLHWETAAIVSGGLSADGFLDALSDFRDKGGRIIWTMHNLIPHDQRDQAAAKLVRNGLFTLADIVHLHSLPALSAAMEQHTLPLDKVRIIPHGNYDGVYAAIPRKNARSALLLDDEQTVALLPGQIRAYKKPAALLDAFLDVAGRNDRLILAGHRASDVDNLAIPDDPRIITKFGFMPDEDIALVYAAADFVVLPYAESLTSGSAILAHSLGRGVLGSDTAGLRDAVLVPSTGTLFDHSEPSALADALRTALAEGPELWAIRGKAGARAARARDWTALGAAWRSLYHELASLPRSARVHAS